MGPSLNREPATLSAGPQVRHSRELEEGLVTARRYELGIIPCSKAKNVLGVTPLTLYRSTPFSVMVKHAQQRCGRILIMSAKYGLLKLDDRVANYNTYLPTLRGDHRAKLARTIDECAHQLKLLEIHPRQVLSYLPEAYYRFLASEVPDLEEWASEIRRPYKGLPMINLVKVLSNEIKGFETPGLARR
jgi:hypothetical protein